MDFANAMERLVLTIQKLSLAKDLNSIIEIVRKEARQLTGADGATFILRDGDKCYYVDEDAIGPLWKGKRFPMEMCISGWAMLHRKAAIIEDIYQDDRIPADAYRPTFVKSLVMMPIRTSSPIGAIGNYWARTYCPSPEEVKILQALADSTSIAMENVQLYSDLKNNLDEKTHQEEKYRHLSGQLQISLNEKEILLKEVYHRVKNNLQIVSSLLNLQSEASPDVLIKKNLAESIKRINAMALVHEMLYQSDDKSKIIMSEYINNLLKYLYSYTDIDTNRIQVKTDIDALSLSLDRAIPCGIIINELMTNAFKHAFPNNRSGEIVLAMKSHNGLINLVISDNGVGMNSTEMDNENKIGLSLVKGLVGQIDGQFKAETNKGTAIKIAFSHHSRDGSGNH